MMQTYHDHLLSGNQYLKTLSLLFSRFLLEYIRDRMHSRQNRKEQNAFQINYTSSHVESKQNAFYSILFYSILFYSILSRMHSKNVLTRMIVSFLFLNFEKHISCQKEPFLSVAICSRTFISLNLSRKFVICDQPHALERSRISFVFVCRRHKSKKKTINPQQIAPQG